MLLEQLDLLDAKMREAADAILAHDSERLLANGRFLADRFATSSLQRGAAPATPAAPAAQVNAEIEPAVVEEAAVPAAAPIATEASNEAVKAAELERDRVR